MDSWPEGAARQRLRVERAMPPVAEMKRMDLGWVVVVAILVECFVLEMTRFEGVELEECEEWFPGSGVTGMMRNGIVKLPWYGEQSKCLQLRG